MDTKVSPSGARGLMMSVAIDGEHVVVSLLGEIDADNASSLLSAASAVLETGDRSLRIDCSAVTYLDWSVLRDLLICEACLGREGVDVKLRNVPNHVRDVLKRTQLEHLIEPDASVRAVTGRTEASTGARCAVLAAVGS